MSTTLKNAHVSAERADKTEQSKTPVFKSKKVQTESITPASKPRKSVSRIYHGHRGEEEDWQSSLQQMIREKKYEAAWDIISSMSRNDPEVAWFRAKLLRLILSKQQSLLPLDALYRSFSKNVVSQEENNEVRPIPPPRHVIEEISRDSLKALQPSLKPHLRRQPVKHIPDNLTVKLLNSPSHFNMQKFLEKHSVQAKGSGSGDSQAPTSMKWKGSVRQALEEARVEAFGAVLSSQTSSADSKVHLKTIADSNLNKTNEKRAELLAAIRDAAAFWLVSKKRKDSEFKKTSTMRLNHLKKMTRRFKQLEAEHKLESIRNLQTYKKVLNQDLVGYALALEERDTLGLSSKEKIIQTSIEKLKASTSDGVSSTCTDKDSIPEADASQDLQLDEVADAAMEPTAAEISTVLRQETANKSNPSTLEEGEHVVEGAGEDEAEVEGAGENEAEVERAGEEKSSVEIEHNLKNDVDANQKVESELETSNQSAGKDASDEADQASDKALMGHGNCSVLNRLRAKSLSSVLEYVVSHRKISNAFDVNRLYVRPRYVGQTVSGRREGLGILQFAEGPAFQGEWKEDVPCGAGVERYTDGTKYSGFFLEGMRDGLGIFTLPNKICYLGCWKGGKRCSVGLVAVQKDAAIEDSFYDMLPVIKLEFPVDSDHPKSMSKFDKDDLSHTLLWSDAILAANFALKKSKEAETVVMNGFYKPGAAQRSTENLGVRLRSMPSSVRAYLTESFSKSF
mmetsp:Transcript_21049/g.70162  ORF Transcript_21049/g.70162 Transcript_21049/m.70162 type:complete len:737 (-) Transcript_21049:30-2240(-)